MTFATLCSLGPLVEEECARMGIGSRLASVRFTGIPVLDLQSDVELLMARLAAESVLAVREDRAHVIVLGCTGLTGLGVRVRTTLAAEGFDVPVIDPLPVAVHLATMAHGLGICHSRVTYQGPRQKLRNV